MQIVFDLQEYLQAMQSDKERTPSFLRPTGSHEPTITICNHEDEKCIHVTHRATKKSGVVIDLPLMQGIMPDDRITIMGRISDPKERRDWGISLLSQLSIAENQVAQQAVPHGIFLLTHQLDDDDLKKPLFLQTTKWGSWGDSEDPNFDFFVDSILVSRDIDFVKQKKEDRAVVYDLNSDIAICEATLNTVNGTHHSLVLRQSGTPSIYIVSDGDGRAIHVTRRTNNYDGFDICMAQLNLIQGEEYRITVTGRADGEAPEDAQIMLQGIPGYHWRSLHSLVTNQDFTLSYTLKKSSLEQWEALRIATNQAGAHVPYFIYSIEITTG